MLVGGLVGTNGGTIIDSSAMGDTRGSGSNIGGLVGSNTGEINRSYATGPVSGAGHLGGLVGSNNDGATVTNTYTIGDVTGTEQSSYVGGLIGSNSGRVAESFATGEVDGDVIIGGLIGETDGSSLTGDNDGGTVTDSYWDRGTTNQSDAVGSGTGTNLTGFGTVGTDEPAGAMTGDDALADDNMDALSNSVWATVDESTTGSSGDGYPVLAALPLDPQILVPARETSADDPSATEPDPESGGGENDSNDEGGTSDASNSDDGGDSTGEGDSSDASGSDDGDDSSDASSSSGGGDSTDEGDSSDASGSDDGGDSTDEGDSSDASSSSGGGGGGSGGSGSGTFLLGERVHTQTLDHSTLKQITIDFAEPVDGLIRVAVVETPDRPTIESSATVVGAVSITPPRESTETNATLAFSLNATALEASEIDPADIAVYRIDTAGTVHEPVTVSVTAETNDMVIVAAETPGFSTFVLATTQPEVETEPEAVQGASVQGESVTETTDGSLAEESRDESESTTEDTPVTTEASNVATPGFGPLVALVALVMLVLVAVGRNWDHP